MNQNDVELALINALLAEALQAGAAVAEPVEGKWIRGDDGASLYVEDDGWEVFIMAIGNRPSVSWFANGDTDRETPFERVPTQVVQRAMEIIAK